MIDIDNEVIGLVLPLHPNVQVAINDGGTVDPRLAGVPCLGIVGELGDVIDMLNLLSQAVGQARW